MREHEPTGEKIFDSVNPGDALWGVLAETKRDDIKHRLRELIAQQIHRGQSTEELRKRSIPLPPEGDPLREEFDELETLTTPGSVHLTELWQEALDDYEKEQHDEAA